MLFALMVFSCKQANFQLPTVEYKTVKVEPMDITVHSTFAAKLEGVKDVNVFPQTSGSLVEIRVAGGQKVNKGDVMFVVDQVPAQAAVRVAESDLKVAKAQMATAKIVLESKQDLRSKDIVSDIVVRKAQNDYETAVANVEQAEARLTNARQSLSFPLVKAPCNGVVGSVPYKVGEIVGPDMPKPLTIVSDNSKISAKIAINERMWLSLVEEGYGNMSKLLKELPDVKLITSLGSYYPETGRITAIDGMIDATTGTISLKADFPNPEGALRSGGSAKVEIPIPYTDVLVIPQSATYELQDKIFAYKVVDNKAKAVEVKVTSLDDGQSYAVLEGLQAGDVIIAEGAGNVKEGEEVSYQMTL